MTIDTRIDTTIDTTIDNKQTVYIAGAGLAGCVLATFLAQRGFCVEVFEKRNDMRQHSVEAGRSINLALAERGIVALREIGVLDPVMAMALPMRGRMIHDRDGNEKLQPYSLYADEVIHSVHRGQLNRILIDAAEAAGVVFRFDCVIDRLDLADKRLHTADGEALSIADTPLFGCDGAGSVVREALRAARKANVSVDWLAHGYREFTLPPGADGAHRMAPDALHIWPRGRFMLIALPNPDGSFTATLFLPHEGEAASFAAIEPTATAIDFFNREFPDFMALIEDFPAQHEQHPIGQLATVRTAPWFHDQVALVGDAAHAVVPFHGQGMNCAFEDCSEINRLLGQGFPDWPDLFEEYENRRRDNANAIADMALENYIEMRDSVADPRFQLQKELEAVLYDRLPDYFVPRYAMVMFRTLPYAEARERGRIQTEILDRLSANASSIDQIDLDAAERLVKEHLPIFQPE